MTLIGTGAAGYSDQQVNDPYGLLIGPDGNLYFCDLGNQRIRRLDLKSRRIQTVAGNGQRGYSGDGAAATDASLNMPHEIQFDSRGNLYIDPTPLACTECGERLTLFGSGGDWCLLCGKIFCARHLIIRKGVPNCAACEAARRIREETSGVSDADEARVVRLTLQDLAFTVGPGHEAAVQEAAARIFSGIRSGGGDASRLAPVSRRSASLPPNAARRSSVLA